MHELYLLNKYLKEIENRKLPIILNLLVTAHDFKIEKSNSEHYSINFKTIDGVGKIFAENNILYIYLDSFNNTYKYFQVDIKNSVVYSKKLYNKEKYIVWIDDEMFYDKDGEIRNIDSDITTFDQNKLKNYFDLEFTDIFVLFNYIDKLIYNSKISELNKNNNIDEIEPNTHHHFIGYTANDVRNRFIKRDKTYPFYIYDFNIDLSEYYNKIKDLYDLESLDELYYLFIRDNINIMDDKKIKELK